MRLSIEFSLAAIMALVLYFAAGKNSTILNILLLTALFGFCLHPALGVSWVAFASPPAIKAWRILVVVAIVLIAVVRFGIWVWPVTPALGVLPFVEISHVPSNQASSVTFKAYLQPDQPYPDGMLIGGISWLGHYVDVRLDVANGPVQIKDLDFSVQLDTSIAAVGQISQFQGITAFPGSEPPPTWLEGTDAKGQPMSTPIVPSLGMMQSSPVYRVHCSAVLTNTVVHFVIASIALNPPTATGKLPQHLFAPRRAPTRIMIKGGYRVGNEDKYYPVEFASSFPHKPQIHRDQSSTVTINALTVEVRLKCSLRYSQTMPEDILDGVLSNDRAAYFEGSEGKAHLQISPTARYQRSEEDGEAYAIQKYSLPSDSNLIGASLSRLRGYEYLYLVVPAVQGDSFTGCSYAETTVRVNGKDLFRYSGSIQTIPPKENESLGFALMLKNITFNDID